MKITSLKVCNCKLYDDQICKVQGTDVHEYHEDVLFYIGWLVWLY